MENKVNIDAVEAAIVSTICFMLIGEKTSPKGSKLDLLEELLKKTSYDNYQFWNRNTKHVMRMMRISYANWKARMFRYEDQHQNLKEVRMRCERLAKICTSYFTNLKDKISDYLKRQDCVYTDILAYNCTIVSLIVFANKYSELAKKCQLGELVLDKFQKKATTQQDMAIYSLGLVQDWQFKRNVDALYPYVFYPDGGIDVNSDPKINKAMDELASMIYSAYVANFTEKAQENLAVAK